MECDVFVWRRMGPETEWYGELQRLVAAVVSTAANFAVNTGLFMWTGQSLTKHLSHIIN